MKKKIGEFGSTKNEEYVEKVYEAMEEEKMWPRFAVDMTKRDELDARIQAEREKAVEEATESIRKKMEVEIRSQVRAEVATEVCFVYATCVGESCPVD